MTTTLNPLTALIAPLIEQETNRFQSLAAHRQKAYLQFLEWGLPGNKNEEYKHTPISKAIEKIGMGASESKKVHTAPSPFPHTDAYALIFINGIFSPEQSSPKIPGILFSSLEEAVEKKQEKALSCLLGLDNPQHDAFLAWNTAAWKSGLYIEIPNGVSVDKPILIHHIQDATSSTHTEVSRIIIHCGKSSEAHFIESHSSTGTHAHFRNLVTDVFVAENASFNLINLQDDQGLSYQVQHVRIHQEADSRSHCHTYTFSGKIIRNNLQVFLNGKGCESHLHGLYLLKGDTLADNHTVVDHRIEGSHSNELYKGILDENGKAVFNGKIYVRPDAQKTNAFQSNRNILLSEKATLHTKPQLEIWADDVKCSHGCTSGQMDEEALFYLRSRGIDKASAKSMVLYAFALEVTQSIKDKTMSESIQSLIQQKLSNQYA